MMSVFKDNNKFRLLNFRNWIVNLDVWGSYLPLNAQCYDLQLTRA